MSYVVTGGGRGVGRAIVESLVATGSAVAVAVVEFEAEALGWASSSDQILPIIGDAGDEAVAMRAAAAASRVAPLRGWVNNAAVFADAWLHETPAAEMSALIARNVDPVLAGCAAALRCFLGDKGGSQAAGAENAGVQNAGVQNDGSQNAGTQNAGGSIVNISSHQAQRPVRGALAYATAKAAVEGLTRALAVDYGRFGVRVNALALGSIATERSASYLSAMPEEQRDGFDREIRLLQPLGRMGYATEVADAVSFLLSDRAAFINGAIIPVDGGRSAVGRDPEEA
jgi:NAD(P)-dependent dehydrogenase (short-subunit alcohol dehydrogenase family)